MLKHDHELDRIIDGLLAQQTQVKAMQRSLAKEHIEKALKCVDINELHELADEIYAKEFALGEMADHLTIQ
ncbi:hypothetical protein A1D22_05965 [Pasteurellaceae bacterium LFhippo2]|nr:hypothetical protein [Pasteurellaceae bacterium LFhippo2]